METYLLKTVLCSTVFIGFYYLVLENQKEHHFKRFFLLSSLLFSMIIPSLSIRYGVVYESGDNLGFSNATSSLVNPETSYLSFFNFKNVILGIYVLVAFALLLKFFLNLNALGKEIRKSKKVKFGDYFFVLKESKTTPHSFLKYIFLNRNDFESGKIDERIILHEKTHLDQKHSYDILFMEFLLVIFWFNPAFYFYKRAILTNHEFLADESVLNKVDVLGYQELLLSELLSEKMYFTNQFNFKNTKKRIKMMSKPNQKNFKINTWLTLPIALVSFFVFAEKVPSKISTPAQVKKEVGKSNVVSLPKKEREIEQIEKPVQTKVADTLKKPLKEKVAKSAAEAAAKAPKDEKMAPAQPEKPAEYPGGISDFRNKFVTQFNSAVVNGLAGLLRAEITFDVDENGNTSNYVVQGGNEVFNNELLRATKSANEGIVWKPAETEGKPVASKFRMPVTMNFAK